MRGILLRSGDREDENDTTGIVEGEGGEVHERPLGGMMDDGD
jgi:hypothetical protein